MSGYPPIAPLSASEPPEEEDFDATMDARPPPVAFFDQSEMDRAIAESLRPVGIDADALEAGLGEAKRLHDADLYKTQNSHQECSLNSGNVLILVKFPDSRPVTSCRFTVFNPGRIRLTYEQVLATGADLLADLLVSERHQRRAKKAATPLPEGVEYVLDLSPTIDEDDYTIALQLLSIPRAVQLWQRSMAIGTSPLAVAGHDDVCSCLVPFDEPYPFPMPPGSIQDLYGTVCILDTKEWPLEEDRKIDDFCTTRWAANLIRLFRAISMPPGQKDLLVDSAPRLWTLVGLFAKLEMKNYDLLRDDVVAWFNTDMNNAFVELCPEETLHIGLTLDIPLLSEPAFRILVNERALEVAGGQPRLQPTTTLFGRHCSDFTGTAIAESISRMIEHASNAMAERYKAALDGITGDRALDLLDIPEWQKLRALDDTIPKDSKDENTRLLRDAYDLMMTSTQHMFRNSVERVVHCPGSNLNGAANSVRNGHFLRNGITTDQVEERRAYSVPKSELKSTQNFKNVYTSLNRQQRALTPYIWHGLSAMADDLSSFVFKEQVANSAIDFKVKFDKVQRGNDGVGAMKPGEKGVLSHGSCTSLLHSIREKLKAYVKPMVTQDELAFTFTLTPHLVLVLNDHEMNFLRRADDETTFQTEAPETDLGPSGPGPAFHTGQTTPSVSDLDFENLTVESSAGASTIGGSMAAQDGNTTVYDRRRVLARSVTPSVASEQFTDSDMSAEYAEAEHKVPVDQQVRGHTLLHLVDVEQAYDEEEEEEDDLDDLDLDEYSDSSTIMGDDGADEDEPDRADHSVDNGNVGTRTTSSNPSTNEPNAEAIGSKDFDDSDFEVIRKDETI